MNLNEFKYKANYYAILLLAFVIPLERRLAPPLIILFLVTSLINNKFKEIKNHTILLFSSLYLLYLFGLLYTSNINVGLTNVLENLSLLIFPLAIYVANIDFKEKLYPILFSFIDGCLVSVVISIIQSLIGYFFTHDASLFFYGNGSAFLHPSYFAMHLCFGIIVIYFFYFKPHEKYNLNPLKVLLLIVVFSIMTMLLSSKTGLIALLLIHTVGSIYWIIKHKAYLKGTAIILTVMVAISVTYYTSSMLHDRINELLSVVSSEDTSGESSTAARAEIWEASYQLIRKNSVFGYGTGDVKDVLIHSYKERNLTSYADKKLNTHNQFLQTFIAIGLLGGITLILLLVVPLIWSFRQKHYLYTFFILLMLLNFLTESILERQAGVVFYAFFNALLFAAYSSSRKQLIIN